MKKLIRILLLKPVLWAARTFSSKPNRKRIFEALSKLFESVLYHPGKKGLVVPFEEHAGKFIIFSDQHKGARDGADDFMMAEPNYLAALEYYYQQDFFFISLGDNEELWENSLSKVKKFNVATFEAEKKFLARNAFIKIFGNHDLYWDNDPLAWWQLKSIYGEKLKVYEGVVLPVAIGGKTLRIFCTHGHQGDTQSDGNWFSKFFVANIWAPLQSFLHINPNTPAYDAVKKTLHNVMMYDWSSKQKDMLLITGHTHQPVFGSLTHLERLYQQYQAAGKEHNAVLQDTLEKEIRARDSGFTSIKADYSDIKPGYFNSGCCCFSDGDISGIEIDGGCIRLIKWSSANEKPVRVVLEEASLEELAKQL